MGSIPPYTITSRRPRPFTSPHPHLHYNHHGYHPHAYTEGSIHSVCSLLIIMPLFLYSILYRAMSLGMSLHTFTMMEVKVISIITFRHTHFFNQTLPHLLILLGAQVVN